MTDVTTKKGAPSRPSEVVLAYPDNKLTAQRRDYKETFSAFSLVKATFFDKK